MVGYGPDDNQRLTALSVVICTFNRASSLDRTLTSLSAQTISEMVQVVVVNNDSTDNTAAVLAKWIPNRHFRLTAVFEPNWGLSNARNSGTLHSEAPIIAFLDDDVWVPPEWAEQLLRVFSTMPELAGVAGAVELQWEQWPPPLWICDELLCAVGGGQFGVLPGPIAGKQYPIGANMAFRANVFREVGGFNPHLGRIGNDLTSYEEVEFVHRLRKFGGSVYYDPRVKVTHFVPKQRAKKPYILARRRSDGESIAIWEYLSGGQKLVIRNALARVALILARDIPGYFFTMWRKKQRHFTYVCRLAKAASYLRQAGELLSKGFPSANQGLLSLPIVLARPTVVTDMGRPLADSDFLQGVAEFH